MKLRFAIQLASLAVISLSCRSMNTSNLKDDVLDSEPEGFQINSSLLVADKSLLLPSSGGTGNVKLFIGNAVDINQKQHTILYSTNNFELKHILKSDSVDLSGLGESFDWDLVEKGEAVSGKFVKIQNKAVTDLCSSEQKNTCKIELFSDKVKFDFLSDSFSFKVLKSLELNPVSASFDFKDDLVLTYIFGQEKIPVNIAEADASEYSFGFRCNENTYSFDYFSGQVKDISEVSILELMQNGQKSIWNKDGENIIDQQGFAAQFLIEVEGKKMKMKFNGELATKIKADCEKDFDDKAIVVDGDLVKRI